MYILSLNKDSIFSPLKHTSGEINLQYLSVVWDVLIILLTFPPLFPTNKFLSLECRNGIGLYSLVSLRLSPLPISPVSAVSITL
jgi:hypothetical protein